MVALKGMRFPGNPLQSHCRNRHTYFDGVVSVHANDNVILIADQAGQIIIFSFVAALKCLKESGPVRKLFFSAAEFSQLKRI